MISLLTSDEYSEEVDEEEFRGWSGLLAWFQAGGWNESWDEGQLRTKGEADRSREACGQ